MEKKENLLKSLLAYAGKKRILTYLSMVRKVAECGSPEKLSSNGGFYSRMTDIQKQSLDWAL